MSEKRFELGYIQSTWWKITDTQTGNVIEHNERKVTDLLNSLDNECNFLAEQRQYLKKENEQLRQQLKQKQEEERLYAKEILKLNKEAKEVLDFKTLGGDY